MEHDAPIFVVLLGPPGAGKGTQAAHLCERMGISHLSTGEVFRHVICERTSVGLQVQSLVESGQLVPDDLVVKVVEEFLDAAGANGACFDGFPRTLEQAHGLDRVLASRSESLSAVVVLQLDDEKAVQRMVARGRIDDNKSTTQHRLKLHHETAGVLIEYYGDRDLLKYVDGDADIATVGQRVGRLFAGERR